MPYQTQEEEKREPFDEQFYQDLDEQEMQSRQDFFRREDHRKEKLLSVGGIGMMAVVILITSMVVFSKSSATLVVDDVIRTVNHSGTVLNPITMADSDSLPIEEMSVFDADGLPLWGVYETDEDSHTYSFEKNKPFTLSRGLGHDASWADFVEAYGDLKYDYIYYSDMPDEVASDLTIREFNNEYLKNVDTEDLYISVDFDYYFLNDTAYRSISEYVDKEMEMDEDEIEQSGNISYSVTFYDDEISDVSYYINTD